MDSMETELILIHHEQEAICKIGKYNLQFAGAVDSFHKYGVEI
jgi:hypothetical protein